MEIHQATAERLGRRLVPSGEQRAFGPHARRDGEVPLAGGLPVTRIVPVMSNRLVRIEEHQWLGDKRTFIVHDQDNVCDPAVLEDIAAAESWATFGPDTSDRGPQPRIQGLQGLRRELAWMTARAGSTAAGPR